MEGPSMEIDPSRFIVVLGPSFSAAVLRQVLNNEEDTSFRGTSPTPKLPAFDAKGLIDEGIAILLESRQFQSEAEKGECEQLYRRALEVDPLMKLSTSMQQCGRYAEWLERCFRLDAGLLAKCRRLPLLSNLVDLLERGALLLYTGCDEVLSKLTNLQILLAQKQEAVVQWGKGELKGIMHVHGVYWKPDSLQLGCEVYVDPQHPSRAAMEQLGAIFKDKCVITLGVCETTDSPMVAKFATTFLEAGNGHHFNLSLTPNKQMGAKLLNIYPSPVTLVPVRSISDTSKILYKEIEFPPMDVSELRDHQLMALLVSHKQEASEVAKLTFSSPGVNFALVSSVTISGQVTYTVSLRVESSKLQELWVWLWEEKKALLASLGLQAVVMQGGTIVWLPGNPAAHHHHAAGEMLKKQLKQEMPDSIPMEMMPPPPPPATTTMATTVLPNHKLLSPLVRQEFPIPKHGTKKVPRYTITKFPMKPTVGTSFTLPPGTGNGLSKTHYHGFSDDTNMYSHLDLPKSVLARRCSLPPNIITTGPGASSENTLYRLAENISSEHHPPSYAAIKQALLCDKYKRRQSMQTDPKTLKNLLQTKLVISDNKTEDLVNLRRKSDPGSYMKQRDFDRRKELFLDENLSWSKSYGRVIDQQIQRWQRKRQQKLQRDFLQWSGSALNPLKIGMINPLMATQQGIVNPLQVAGGGLANPALFQGSFLNTAAAGTAGSMVAPYILPQGIVGGASGATTNSNIYYNPFGTQYTLVSPYPSLQVGQSPQTTTYLVPQANLPTAQPGVYYYMPATALPTTTAVSSSASTAVGTATPLILGSNSSSVTMPASGSPLSSNASSPGATVYPTIDINAAQAISPTTLKPRPISPTSRKRHQSVPEKLTSLLQPPPILCGRVSPMETNPDSPPSSKKQRSTSDTTLYHTPYGFPQHSPGGGQIHSPGGHSHSTSPQPPPSAATNTGVSFDGLTALQSHLLNVHGQSYGMSRTAAEERQRRRNRSPREKGGSGQGHSPRRKHSGGVKNGSVSPNSVQSNEGEEFEQRERLAWGKVTEESRVPVSEREERGEGRVLDNNHIKMENSAPEQHNNDTAQITLWQFLLELLVSSDTDLLHWTDNEFEFQISKPMEVSQLWGQFSNVNGMSYEKLYAAFKYYFNQGIMSQVQGRKLTFKFAGHIRNYVQLRRSQSSSPSHEEMVVVE